MTASKVRERAPERARPARWAAHRSREALVFSVATTVALLHALDDAFFHRRPGVGHGQHAPAAGLSLVLGLGATGRAIPDPDPPRPAPAPRPDGFRGTRRTSWR